MRQNPQAQQLEVAAAQELLAQLLVPRQGPVRGAGLLQEGVTPAQAADQICPAGQGHGLLAPTVSPHACRFRSGSNHAIPYPIPQLGCTFKWSAQIFLQHGCLLKKGFEWFTVAARAANLLSGEKPLPALHCPPSNDTLSLSNKQLRALFTAHAPIAPPPPRPPCPFPPFLSPVLLLESLAQPPRISTPAPSLLIPHPALQPSAPLPPPPLPL